MKKITKKEEKRLEKKRKNKLWKETREKVLERDKCCVLCGSTYKLNVHHILEKEFIIFRHLQFDERNLITACPKCHKFGQFSFHKCPLYALEVFKQLYPENYEFLVGELKKIKPKSLNTLYS
jgi:hypothetical protein